MTDKMDSIRIFLKMWEECRSSEDCSACGVSGICEVLDLRNKKIPSEWGLKELKEMIG